MPHDGTTLLTVLPPLAAYRRDLARLGVDRLSAHDERWLAAAMTLSHMASQSGPHTDEAEVHLASLLDAAGEGGGAPPLDAPDRPSPPLIRRARVLAERMEEASAWHVTLALLALMERVLHPEPLDAGRIRAQRARIQWKSGDISDAEAAYKDLWRAGRAMREPELMARACVGLATVSQQRGNYPAVARWAARAAAIAHREGYSGIDALAEQLLMVSAGQCGAFAQALEHGWAAFQTAHGDPAREAEMLLNLAQLLLRMGEHRSALTGFVAAIEREPPPRIALPAWGGVATSASRLGDRRVTRLAATRIERITSTPGLEYARASALTEAALGLERLGLDGGAWRSVALSLADRYHFHELRLRLESSGVASVPSTANDIGMPSALQCARSLGATSTAVISAVDGLADLERSLVLV
jgi:tetratricopeptide (TPR) repeat protein